jgi:hypothetical protein
MEYRAFDSSGESRLLGRFAVRLMPISARKPCSSVISMEAALGCGRLFQDRYRCVLTSVVLKFLYIFYGMSKHVMPKEQAY